MTVTMARKRILYRPGEPHRRRTVTRAWQIRLLTVSATAIAFFAAEPVDRAEASPQPVTSTSALSTLGFDVPTSPPFLALDPVARAVPGNRPAYLTGVTNPHGRVDVNGKQLAADSRGVFGFVVERPSDGPVTVAAVGPLGLRTTEEVTLLTVPSRVTHDAYRAVHVGFCGWSNPTVRERILTMADEGRINAVQLDLKDEAGHVGYATNVGLAHTVGATSGQCRIDLEAAVELLHSRGLAVIGRVVAFADPLLAQWAWANDHRDWVIQDTQGNWYRGSYQGFTNFANPDVVAYNIAVAEEAARKGVDHILWDYVRRPEGRVSTIVFPGLEGTPEDGIVEFVRRADRRLSRWGIEHGASVFGIAVASPTSIAQDIPRMARHLDYVAPMLYPSHWGPNHFGLADPVRDPYTVIFSSLATFEDAVDGLRARVIPWLEDTPYRAWNRPLQVREQLRATADRGIDEWLLWNPADHYTPSAIDPWGIVIDEDDYPENDNSEDGNADR